MRRSSLGVATWFLENPDSSVGQIMPVDWECTYHEYLQSRKIMRDACGDGLLGSMFKSHEPLK